MSTTVTYNGITLKNVQTREWDETVVYDESGTDPLGVRLMLTFDALVHTQGTDAPVGIPGTWAEPVSKLADVKRRLEQPRKSLVVTFGSQTILSVEPWTGQQPYLNFDTENGPKPQGVQIVHVAADKCFRIRWKVAVALRNCLAPSSSWVLNHRWAVRESMDAEFKITRTVTGMLRAAAGPTASTSFHVEAFRGLCFPPLEDGFRRANCVYQTEKTGNALNYEIVDQQWHYAPPYPAVSMTGTHTISTGDGVNFFQSLGLSLIGGPAADPRDLLQRAVQVAFFRLNADGTGTDLGAQQMIVDAQITEHIGQHPRIDLSLKVQEMYGSSGEEYSRLPLTSLRNNSIGQMILPPLSVQNANGDTEDVAIEYQVNKHPVPALYGYNEWGGERNVMAAAFLRCVLQDQCGGSAAFVGGSTSGIGGVTGGETRGTAVQPMHSETELNDPTLIGTFDVAHLDAMYLMVSAASTVEAIQPVAQLPVAGGTPRATLVKLGPQLGGHKVVIDYERVSKPPEIPPWEATDIGQQHFEPVYVGVELLPPKWNPTTSTMIHRARASYLYLSDKPWNLQGPLPVGRLPHVGSSNAETTVDGSELFKSSEN